MCGVVTDLLPKRVSGFQITTVFIPDTNSCHVVQFTLNIVMLRVNCWISLDVGLFAYDVVMGFFIIVLRVYVRQCK